MPKKALKTVPNESHSEITKRLAYFQERKDQMVQTIRQLVEIESPSDNKEAVDEFGGAAGRPVRGTRRSREVSPRAQFRRSLAGGFRGRPRRQAGAAAGAPGYGLSHGHFGDHALPRGRWTFMGAR